jgi:hypothetical protein
MVRAKRAEFQMLVRSKIPPPTAATKKIPLNNGLFALVDDELFDWLNVWKWYAKKSFSRFYACRKVISNGRTYFIRMHRFINNTPPNWVCHHINGNTLDNRGENLLNMTWYEHAKMHSYR